MLDQGLSGPPSLRFALKGSSTGTHRRGHARASSHHLRFATKHDEASHSQQGNAGTGCCSILILSWIKKWALPLSKRADTYSFAKGQQIDDSLRLIRGFTGLSRFS